MSDINQLSSILRKKGYFLTKYNNSNKFFKIFQRKPSFKDLSMFCNSLGVLLESGMNVIQAVRIVYFNSDRRTIKNSLYSIYFGLMEGKSVYESIKQFKNVYPYFMIEMIGVGEQGGKLDKVCKRLSEYYEKQHKLCIDIKSSLMYPVIVFIVSIFTIVFITSTIIPQFISTLKDMGANVPFLTHAVLNLLSALKEYFLIIVIGTFVSAYMFLKYISSKNGRYKYDSLKLKIPLIKNIYSKLLILRFSLAAGILMSSGCNAVLSMEKSINVLNNKFVENKMFRSIQYIKSGRSIYDAFKCEIHDLPFLYALHIGEETGNLDGMLLKLGEELQINIEYKLKRLIKFIEPACILVLALFVGTFIISALLPIVNIMDSIN